MKNITQTQFMVYRDGQIDKQYYIKKQSERLIRAIGSMSYKAIETSVNALDELVEAYNAQYN